jgi:hypothetical protein
MKIKSVVRYHSGKYMALLTVFTCTETQLEMFSVTDWVKMTASTLKWGDKHVTKCKNNNIKKKHILSPKLNCMPQIVGKLFA